jgi:putative membrane protein
MNTKKIIFISVLTLVGFAGAYLFSINTGFGSFLFHNNWRPMGSGFYHGHMRMGGIMHFIFWLVLLFFLMSVLDSGKPSFANTSDSAIEILKKKYVNGDISKTEFNDKMKHLID